MTFREACGLKTRLFDWVARLQFEPIKGTKDGIQLKRKRGVAGIEEVKWQ